jgi:hypothetical protein
VEQLKAYLSVAKMMLGTTDGEAAKARGYLC